MSLHDWRLAPAAVAAWAGAWLGTSEWTPSVLSLVGITALSAITILWMFRQRWLAVAVVVLLVTSALASWRTDARRDSPLAELAQRGAVVTVMVRIEAEPQQTKRISWARAAILRVNWSEGAVVAHEPVVLLASGEAGDALHGVEPGGEYEMMARLSVPEPSSPEAAVLSVRYIGEQHAAPSLSWQGVNALWRGLRAAMGNSSPEQSALVPSLVVGDTSAVDETMRTQFKITGLAHLMAVSGSNLVLFLSAWLALLKMVGVRGWSIPFLGALAVAGFVTLCGPEPSVIRAAAMGLVALAGAGIATGRRSLRGLFVAVLVLMWLDPWLARSIGFALSAGACAGIVVLGPRFVAALATWAPRWIAEAIAVPLAAQLATLPIIVALSGQISLVGLVANVLAGPFVGPTTILGLAAAFSFWAPPLSACLGFLAGWAAQPIIWLAAWGETLPSATIGWPTSPLGVAAAAGVSACIAIVMPSLIRRRITAVAVLAALTGASAVQADPYGWPGQWQVMVCDVGQGDATLVRAGPHSAVLVDAAPEAREVLKCLSSAGITEVPLLVLSHFHADHTGGAGEIVNRFRPAVVLTRSGSVPGWLSEAVDKAGTELRAAKPGEVVDVGVATWRTVSVGDPGETSEEVKESAAENDASVIGLASSGGLRVLLAGDAEPAGQSAALRSAAHLGISLSAHVLKLPHHGSAKQERRFFKASGASLAIASAGLGNEYGHPAVAALDMARGLNMAVARTDTEGAIAVSLTGNGLSVVRRSATP